MSAAEKLKALDATISDMARLDSKLRIALPQIVAVVEALDDVAESLTEGRAPKWKREMLTKHGRSALAALDEALGDVT